PGRGRGARTPGRVPDPPVPGRRTHLSGRAARDGSGPVLAASPGPGRERYGRVSTLLLALAAGALVGVTLGALGGGGSILAVPAPVAAAPASLVIVVLPSAAALPAHARDGHVRWRTGLLFAAAGAGPALLGGALAARLPPALLTGAFALVAGAAAVRMLRRRP